MATTRIKDKISAIVNSQLPEFVQTDYTTFVSFIEAYYRFLEQDQSALELVQNARSYNDLDRTTDAFVTYFLKNYATDLPESTLANKRFIIKKIQDLYESKGSELSFKLLFNILFQSDVSVVYPYENVLRASAGRWSQKNSIRVRTVSGDRTNILNRSLLITVNGIDFATPIVEVKNLTSTLTEIFLDPNKLASAYAIGDVVTVNDADGQIFSGVIDPTTTSYFISRPGSGFKIGQIYTVNFSGGVGTLVKVSNVTSAGAITALKFVSYGHSFPDQSFTVDFDPNKNFAETADVLSDRTQGFASFGTIIKIDPTDLNRYFLEDYLLGNTYTATSITEFSDNVFSAATSTSSKPANFATIQFSVGALGRYAGTYLTNDGFISELDIRLENDLLYQPFAYQTNTVVDISQFFDIVTQIIHPAGQRLFNNRLLQNEVDVSANVVVSSSSNVFTELLDVIDTSELVSKELSRLLTDTANILSLPAVSTNKVLNTSSDGFSESGNGFSQSYFLENYTDIDPMDPGESYIEGTSFSII